VAREEGRPDGIDTEGKTVPPYEGRRQKAETKGKEATTRGGARTAGATGPVDDEEMKAADPHDTKGGATRTPADEQPAENMEETRSDDQGTGPSHHGGTPRAEDQP